MRNRGGVERKEEKEREGKKRRRTRAPSPPRGATVGPGAKAEEGRSRGRRHLLPPSHKEEGQPPSPMPKPRADVAKREALATLPSQEEDTTLSAPGRGSSSSILRRECRPQRCCASCTAPPRRGHNPSLRRPDRLQAKPVGAAARSPFPLLPARCPAPPMTLPLESHRIPVPSVCRSLAEPHRSVPASLPRGSG